MSKSAGAPRRRYTDAERAEAVAAARAEGQPAAARRLGLTKQTLWGWVRDAAAAGGGASTASVVSAEAAAQPAPQREPTPASATRAVAPSSPREPTAAVVTAPPSPATPTPPRSTARPRVAKVYTPSQIAQALERVAAIGVRPAAKELGISRNALRDWERKVEKAAKGEGVAPTSGPDPKTIEQRRDAAILGEWRKQQGLGPSQIRNQLRRAGTKVSVHTVRRVMEEAGYRPPKVERRDHTGDYEAVRPG